MEESERTCKKCGVKKPIDEFRLSTSYGKSYRRHSCKACDQEARKGNVNASNKIKIIKEEIPMKYNVIKPEIKKQEPVRAQFTDEDYEILRCIMDNWSNLKEIIRENKTQPDIKQIISEVLSEDYEKVNKTYSMDVSLIDNMKVYCKDNRIYQSDLVNMAVRFFMKMNKKL